MVSNPHNSKSADQLWPSLPNALTLFRLLLNVPLLLCFLSGAFLACFWIYLLQEFLDQADGKLAKIFSLESSTGRFFDPFVDSITHLFGFACFLSLGWLPLWMFWVFLFREFGLGFLRLLGAMQGIHSGGQWPGKAKAFVQALSLAIAWSTLAKLVSLPQWISPLFAASTLLSIFSGFLYLHSYRGVLRKAFF